MAITYNKSGFIGSIILNLCFASLLLFLPLEQNIIQSGYGDGLSQETLPPFYLGGEKLLLYTKVSPSIIKTGDGQNRYLDISVIDYDTEELIQNASYKITVYKDNRTLMEEKFHSQPGPLKLTIEPKGNNVKVTNFSSVSNGIWNTTTGEIKIRGPVFIDPGLYHLSIDILGLGNNEDKIKVPPSGVMFDSWLSVADVKNNNVENEGNKYNITVISYYDRISGFTFVPAMKTISWTMPFDWNMSRIEHQNFLIHEEVKIPRSLFNGSPLQYGAYVNGISTSGKSLAIDPFSSQNITTVHILINKQDIMKLLNEGITNIHDKIMSFSLPLLQLSQIHSSSDIETENGQVSISLDRIPTQLTTGSKSVLLLGFKDPTTGIPLNADVTYGVKITDPTGKLIMNQTSQTAMYNTTGRIEVVFPSKGIYPIAISIEGLAPLDSDMLDTSRNSVARGYLLVG